MIGNSSLQKPTPRTSAIRLEQEEYRRLEKYSLE